MDWPPFGHAVPSPQTSQSAHQNVAPLSPWGPVSPLGSRSPWRMSSPWRLSSPWRMSSPSGVSLLFPLHESTGNLNTYNTLNNSPQLQQSMNWESWRTPSPSGMSIAFSLGESAGNPHLYNPYNNLSQPQQNINSGIPNVQPHLLNRHRTPSGSFVVPSLENVAPRHLRSTTAENRTIPPAPVEETQPPAVSTRLRFSDEEWEKHRLQIRQLWLVEDKSLEETKQTMTQKFNFNPS